jgi:hypothetical protein
MTESLYIDLLKMVAVVFLAGAAILVATRIHSAWPRAAAGAGVLILTAVVTIAARRVMDYPIWREEPVAAPPEAPAPPQSASTSSQAPPARSRVLRRAAPAAAEDAVAPKASPKPAESKPETAAGVPAPRDEKPVVIAARPAVLPAGAVLKISTRDFLSTAIHQQGDTFSAVLEHPLEVDGVVVVEKGAALQGLVRSSRKAGRFGEAAALVLELVGLETSGGAKLSLYTSVQEVKAGRPSKSASQSGLGATLRGAVRGLAGAARRGEDAIVPIGATLDFHLRIPLEVTLPPRAP